MTGSGKTLKPSEFKAWRHKLKLKQKEAADRLGLKKRMIQYYEKGDRDGRPVKIPLYVSLACYAVTEGVTGFDGHTATFASGDEATVRSAEDTKGTRGS